MKELIEEAKKCDSCLEWHKHCKAECCRTVHILLDPKALLSKEKYVFVHHFLTNDMKWYYKLRGVTYVHGVLRFPKENCFSAGNKIVFVGECKLLNNYMCKGHPDKKPDICKDLTATSTNKPNVVITPNCLFKYKQMESEN